MNKQDILNLIQYIAIQTVKLKDKYIQDKDLRIDYLTIFSHSDEEFSEMKNIAAFLGEVIDENNGPVYHLKEPIDIPTGELRFLRIRKPDPERPQKGCNDFAVSDFKNFKQKYIGKFDEHLTLIKRPDYEMIEIKDAEFDVLVYFPSIRFSEKLSSLTRY